MPSQSLPKELNATGDGDGDNRGMGGRDGIKRQTTMAGRIAPGKVASACILVGCKMEEEPRRIRDVVNLSHLLGLPSWEDDDDGTDDDHEDGDSKCVDASDTTGKDEPRSAGIDDGGRWGEGVEGTMTATWDDN